MFCDVPIAGGSSPGLFSSWSMPMWEGRVGGGGCCGGAGSLPDDADLGEAGVEGDDGPLPADEAGVLVHSWITSMPSTSLLLK